MENDGKKESKLEKVKLELLSITLVVSVICISEYFKLSEEDVKALVLLAFFILGLSWAKILWILIVILICLAVLMIFYSYVVNLMF